MGSGDECPAMPLLEITPDDRDAASRFGQERGYGCLLATGWQEKGRCLEPFFHFSSGKRVTLGELPDGPERYARLYPPQR